MRISTGFVRAACKQNRRAHGAASSVDRNAAVNERVDVGLLQHKVEAFGEGALGTELPCRGGAQARQRLTLEVRPPGRHVLLCVLVVGDELTHDVVLVDGVALGCGTESRKRAAEGKQERRAGLFAPWRACMYARSERAAVRL